MEDLLKDIIDENEVESESKFTIDDDNAADWAICKVKVEADELERLTALADDKIAEINEYKDGLKKTYETRTAYLISCLAEYFDKVEHRKTKTQESYQLMSGKLIRKKKPTKLSYDTSELIEYLRENAAEYLEVSPKAKWGEFKKRTKLLDDGSVLDTETGEVLGFIKSEPQPDTFEIKF